MSESAAPRIYDANEDAPNKKPEWHLEVEGSQVR